MKQKFEVTIYAEEIITSREVADALNLTIGTYSLHFNHDDIIFATARKKRKTKEKK